MVLMNKRCLTADAYSDSKIRNKLIMSEWP